MIDEAGYRANVGIILFNAQGKLFWARRIGNPSAWQFPQGGMKRGETLEDALFRELHEEIGLSKEDVRQIANIPEWLYYELPKHLLRHHSKPLCIGQKQRWFLLELISNEDRIHLDLTDTPEFDAWQWIEYWSPLKQVIDFKYAVYEKVLNTFAQHVIKE